MLVKDEADVVGYTVRHLLENVDQLAVADNGSTDGTWEMLQDLQSEYGANRMLLDRDAEVGYWQSDKTTRLAVEALERGHRWVLPCDADECWLGPAGRPISDYLHGVPPDVTVVRGELVNHLPTAQDPDDVSPWRRIGWRLRAPAPLPKVCVRTHPDMRIEMGNHGAWLPGAMLAATGLVVRHYSWRSEEQYVRKIVNGAAAYAATTLPDDVGAHWRMFGNPPNPEAVREHYRTWFFSENPAVNDSLIYDPNPAA